MRPITVVLLSLLFVAGCTSGRLGPAADLATVQRLADMRAERIRALQNEAERLLADDLPYTAAGKFREALRIAEADDANVRAAAATEAARRKAVDRLAADARRLEADGQPLAAYRRLVAALYVDRHNATVRAAAQRLYPAAEAEWRAEVQRWVHDPPAALSTDEATAAGGTPPADEQHRKLAAVLPRVEFANAKFEDVIAFFRDEAGLSIHVKWRALEEVGVMRDTPVAAHLKNVACGSALLLVLDDASGAVGRDDRMAFVVRDGVVVIATNQDLERETCIVVYNIRDLLGRDIPAQLPAIPSEVDEPEVAERPAARTEDGDDDDDDDLFGGPADDDYYEPLQTAYDEDILKQANDLIDLLQKTIDPESWIEGSLSSGSVKYVNGMLIICQTQQNHEQIARILSALRAAGPPAAEKAAAAKPAEPAPPAGREVLLGDIEAVAGSPDTPANRAVLAALARPCPKIGFQNVKLADAFQFLRDVCGVSLHVNWRPLEEVGILNDTPVDMSVEGVSVRTALMMMLDDASGAAGWDDRLGAMVDEGVLLIATNDALSARTYTACYDIRGMAPPVVPEWNPFAGSEEQILLAALNSGQEGQPVPPPYYGRLAQDMAETLQRTIDPESWIEGSRTSATVQHFRGVLVIHQSGVNHAKIARLLAALRCALGSTRPVPAAGATEKLRKIVADAVAAAQARGDLPTSGLDALKVVIRNPADAAPEPQEADAASRRLDVELTGLDFRGEKAEQVFAALQRASGVPLRVRWQALENEGVMRDTKVDLQVQRTTLGAALRLLTTATAAGASFPGHIDFAPDGEAIVVSTAADLDSIWYTLVYDVRDLTTGPSAAAGGPAATLFAGANSPVRGLLVIRQNREGHQRIREALAQLRRALATQVVIDVLPAAESKSQEDSP